MLKGFAADACERHRSIISSIIFFTLIKTGEALACRHSSGTSPRAKDSLKISASTGEISLLHSFSTRAFSPSGPGALCTLSPTNSLATPFWSTVMFPMGENGLAPFEGGSESPSRVKADWNCLLHILAFSFVSGLRIPFSLSEVIPNASFFKRFDK